MKPPRFRYVDPTTVDDAVAVLDEHGGDATVLAGGQSLVPMLSMRLAYPSYLVDVNGIAELDYIRMHDDGVAIGALTRMASGERSGELRSCCPLISKALPFVGHQAIRNRGTFGGSLAHADPAAELPAVLSALGATVTAVGRDGQREIPVEDLFEMPLVSRLEPGELLTAIQVPCQPHRAGAAVVEVARRHGDFALVGVAASATLGASGELDEVRLACFGAGPTPIRLREAESAAAGAEPDRALSEAGPAAAAEISPSDDVHASAEYRRSVAEVLVGRALRAAVDDAARMEPRGDDGENGGQNA